MNFPKTVCSFRPVHRKFERKRTEQKKDLSDFSSSSSYFTEVATIPIISIKKSGRNSRRFRPARTTVHGRSIEAKLLARRGGLFYMRQVGKENSDSAKKHGRNSPHLVVPRPHAQEAGRLLVRGLQLAILGVLQDLEAGKKPIEAKLDKTADCSSLEPAL